MDGSRLDDPSAGATGFLFRTRQARNRCPIISIGFDPRRKPIVAISDLSPTISDRPTELTASR